MQSWLTTLSGFLALTLTFSATSLAFGGAEKETEAERNDAGTLSDRISLLEKTRASRYKRSDDFGTLEAVTTTLAQKLASIEAQFAASQAQFAAQFSASQSQFAASQAKLASLENSQGSVYVHWGRSQCPGSAELVYTGVVGAPKVNQNGGTNRLCLTHTPQFDQAAPLRGYQSIIHGAEWFVPGHDHTDVPCSVCQTSHAKVLMIPGTKTCPSGWTPEYSGHITATSTSYTTSSEFLCADDSPEDREGTGAVLDDGSYFMYSVASCGSLPCPPYVDGKVVTCVVCSK